ncbi:MAG: fasciclin domain-containing protein, partial [Methanothrix soehngenii]|nr:fasciclin domain-containing protein [Methanothrix soehngenii]
MTRKNLIFLSLLFIAGWLCVGSCLAQNNTTAHGVLDAAGELGLTEFSELAESTGLASTLDNQGVLLFDSGSFVIFAPSDDAFSAIDDMNMN